MASNSKLSSVQKINRKDWLAELPDGSTFATDGELTFLAVPDGSVTRVFSSVASSDEVKYRRKVGEYHALSRRDCGDSGLMLPGFWTATEVLDGLQTQMS